MRIIKVRKKFKYKDVELRIVRREEPYLNASDPVIMTRVIAPNGGMIPLHIGRKETLKSIQGRCIDLLDSFEQRGADVLGELTRTLAGLA